MSELLLADISKSISEWNSQALDGKIFEIERDSVSMALSVVKGMSIYTKTDIFVYLCALNLLNAAIKTPEFNGKLSYSIIKPNAGRLIRDIDNLKDASITYYYDQEESCLYIKVEDVIFSFHQVPLTPEILKASFSKPIQWSGIRLQKIAQPIFERFLPIINGVIDNDISTERDETKTESITTIPAYNDINQLVLEVYEELPTLPGWYRDLNLLKSSVNSKIQIFGRKMTDEDFEEALERLGAVINPKYIDKFTGEQLEAVKIISQNQPINLSNSDKIKILKIVKDVINSGKVAPNQQGWFDMVPFAMKLKEYGLEKEKYGATKLLPLLIQALDDCLETDINGSKASVRFNFGGSSEDRSVNTYAQSAESVIPALAIPNKLTFESDQDENKGILKGFHVNDFLEISSYGIIFAGKIRSIGNEYIEMTLEDSNIARLKLESILTVKYQAPEKLILDISKVTEKLEGLLIQGGIEFSSLMHTNATITMSDSKRVWISTDYGESGSCFKSNIIGYDKEKLVKGQRVFSFKVQNGKVYCIILEMTYRECVDIFRRMISTMNAKTFEYKRNLCLSLLTYLIKQFGENEICSDLKELKRNLKNIFGDFDNIDIVYPLGINGNDEDNGQDSKQELTHITDNSPENSSLSDSDSISIESKNQSVPTEDITTEVGTDTSGSQIFNLEPITLTAPKIVGHIDLNKVANTKVRERKTNPTGAFNITINNDSNLDILPDDGTLIRMNSSFGWIQQNDSSENLFVGAHQIVQFVGILDAPEPGDKVIYSIGKNEKGPMAVCVHRQCSREVMESLIDKFESYDKQTAHLLEQQLNRFDEESVPQPSYSILEQALSNVEIDSTKPFSPDEAEIRFAEKLSADEYASSMTLLIKQAIISNAPKSYNLFLRANSYARKNGLNDWSIEILNLAIKTYSSESGKVGYFRSLLKSAKELSNRIAITTESLSDAINYSINKFGEFPSYVKNEILSHKDFNGITLDAETIRSGMYKIDYIKDVKDSLTENPADDLMYLTLIKLELMFNMDTYDPHSDISKFLANRAKKFISVGDVDKYDEARYLLRLSYTNKKLERDDNISVGLYLMTIGSYSAEDIDMYLKGFRDNFKIDEILKNVIRLGNEGVNLELAHLASSNTNLEERISRICNEIGRTPEILTNYKEIHHGLMKELASFTSNPIRRFHSLSSYIKTYNITLGKEVEVIHMDSPKLVSRITEFDKGDNYQDLRIAYNESLRLIQEMKAKLLQCVTMIGYEFILPALEILRKVLKNEFREIEQRVNPEISIEILDEAVKLSDGDQNNESSTFDINIVIRSNRISSRDIILHNLKVSDGDLLDFNELNIDKKLSSGDDFSSSIVVTICPEAIEDGVAVAEFQLEFDDIFSADGTSLSKTYKKSKKITLRKDIFEELENKFTAPSSGSELLGNDNMFYGRGAILEELQGIVLDSWNSQIAIYGQKRSGKSSLINRLMSNLEKLPNIACVKCNLQGYNDDKTTDLSHLGLESWIFKKIAYEISTKNKKTRKYINKTDIEQLFGENADPFLFFEKLMIHLRQIPELQDMHIVVMIDEFTFLYQAIKDGLANENFMRRWKALVETPGVNLQSVVVAQDTLPLFMNEKYAANGFGIFYLKLLTYLSKEESINLITDPIKELRFHGHTEEMIYSYTAGSALFTQIVCSRLVDYLNSKKTFTITREEVENVIDRLCVGNERLEKRSFECLIDEADGSEYCSRDNEHVLRALAWKTRAGGSCKAEDLDCDMSIETTKRILEHLFSRRVISKSEEGNYSINVKLFRQWIINQ